MPGRYTVAYYPSWEQCTAKKLRRRNTLLPVLYPSLDARNHPSRFREGYRLKAASAIGDGHLSGRPFPYTDPYGVLQSPHGVRLTGLFVRSPPAPVDREGTWTHARRPELPQNPPTQLGLRAEKSSGRYGRHPLHLKWSTPGVSLGKRTQATYWARQNLQDRVILGRFQRFLWDAPA